MNATFLYDHQAAPRACGATLYLGCNLITSAGARRIAERLVASPGVVRGLWLSATRWDRTAAGSWAPPWAPA
ncbi:MULTISPECIES: hypothetical protein [unclassified Nonomuraea]|uniref:hypothetical protein n=1 Tax=unclassified Nonomuraea TaxID=2593643 RepID=UPI0034067693